MNEKSRQIFISYAREDEKVAKKLYDDLKCYGIKPWMDIEDLLAGQNWKIAIDNAIKESKYFIAIISSNSVSKIGYVQKELKKALEILELYPNSEIFLLPVRIEDVKPDENKLLEIHWTDLFPSYENGLKKILRVILKDHTYVKIDKTQVTIREALERHKYIEKLVFKNTGNTELELKEIEVSSNWVIIKNEINSILKINEEYILKIIINPLDLVAGWNHASIKINITEHYSFHVKVKANVIKPKEYNYYIGIDLGAKHSMISFYENLNSNSNYQLIQEETFMGPTPLIPNILLFKKNSDNCIIGVEALNQAAIFPELSIRSFPKILEYNDKIQINGNLYTSVELTGLYIQKLIELTEKELYKTKKVYYDIKKAVIAIPSDYNFSQKNSIINACKKANLEIKKSIQKEIILNRSIASAIYYSNYLYEIGLIGSVQNETVRFLDINYEELSINISIIELIYHQNKQLEIKLVSSLEDNNGIANIDLIIMNQLLSLCSLEFPNFDSSTISSVFSEIIKRKDYEWRFSFFADILRARDNWFVASKNLRKSLLEKKTLFDDTRINVSLSNSNFDFHNFYNHEDFNTIVSLSHFKGWIAQFLNNFEKNILDILNRSKFNSDSIDFIIHTGELCLVSLIKNRMKEYFPEIKHIDYEEHAHDCFVLGAAMWGNRIQSKSKHKIILSNTKIENVIVPNNSININSWNGTKDLYVLLKEKKLKERTIKNENRLKKRNIKEKTIECPTCFEIVKYGPTCEICGEYL